MLKFYPQKGQIPKTGEIWQLVGEKKQIVMAHLFDIEKVRQFVPPELQIVSALPGKTLGHVFLGCFGSGSTIEYHELAISPATVKANRFKGFWISHQFVDSEKSLEGGRKSLGLPKEMMEIRWQGDESGNVDILQEGHSILKINYKKSFPGSIRFDLKVYIVSMLDNMFIHYGNKLNANWSFCKTEYEFPPESLLADDLKKMGLGKPLIALCGINMIGEAAFDTKAIVFLPQ